MSNTFKMPAPDSFKVDTEGDQFFTEFEEETIDALTNDRAVVTKLYTSEQVKEILEQCASYFDNMPSREMFGGEVADKIRNIKEMVK